MTHAERTVILGVVAILEKSKDLLRSRMLGEARGKLQTLVDAAPRYSSVCSNTTNGAHVRADALEHECCLPDGGEDCDCHDDEPELIDDTACLACGARL